MPICSTTAAARPAAFSVSGYGASTKCTRRGGFVRACALGGALAPFGPFTSCARAGAAATRVTTIVAMEAEKRRFTASRGEVEADLERRHRGLSAPHGGLERQRAGGGEGRLVEAVAEPLDHPDVD